MLTRMIGAVRVLSASLGALLLSLTQAAAGEPVHSVHGHSLSDLQPPAVINQITVSASVDEDGVVKGSVSVWPSVYLGLVPPNTIVPDLAGWTWVIRLTSLEVTGNVARVAGIIVFDNRFPETNVGCPINFIVTDNGSGASDPSDILEVGGPCAGGTTTLLGGNFTVR